MKTNKLVVVLGMHRSGTSAITKSLNLLGIGLGTNLYPSGDDNPKGFWEDVECIDINERLLKILDSGYDRLDFSWKEIPDTPQIIALKERAIALVKKRLAANNGTWGFKDPRTCRLLIFWKEIFRSVNCDVSYIIAVRNPLSVSKSLNKRNSLEPGKAYILWLQHVIPSILETLGERVVVVDYDKIMDRPYEQLLRISSALKLTLPERNSPAVTGFEKDFLDSELRHSRHTLDNLASDATIPFGVYATYELLYKIASDEISITQTEIEKIAATDRNLKSLGQLFIHIEALEKQLSNERETLNTTLSQKDTAIEAQKTEICRLDKFITEKDCAIQTQEREIKRLENFIAEKDCAIQTQEREIKRLGSYIKIKEEAICAQSQNISELNSILADKDSTIAAQVTEIQAMNKSIADKNSALDEHRKERENLVLVLKDKTACIEELLLEKDYFYSEIDKRDLEIKELYTANNRAKAEILTLFEEITRIKSSRAYRLVATQREMQFGFKKIWVITRLIIAGILPKSVVSFIKKAPLLNKTSEPNKKNEVTGAYIVKHPELVDSAAPVVAHIIANFMTGGSSRLVVDLVEHLGHKYKHFVLTSLNPVPPAYVGVYIEECRFPEDLTPFKEYYERIRPDFIHVHYWGDCDEPWYSKAIEAAAALGIPVIENINTPIPPYRSNIISKYIYVSDYVRNVFGQNQDNGKGITIYPGSNFELFNRGSNEDSPEDCVGMVYRLERDKLNEDSIKPFIRIAQLRPRTRILIVGGGSLLDVYKAAAKEAGVIDNFEFTGYVDYDVLPDLYRRMSLFIAPVWKESFGQVSPFAMSMKVPVIGYDIGAIPEIIGTSDLVAPHDSPDKLAKIAIRLLDSPAERIALGANQQKRAQENFSVEAMITNYAEVYSEVIDSLRKDQM